MTLVQVAITIAVISAFTFVTRVFPFALFPSNKDIPDYVTLLGNVLPYSLMGMLIIYCLKDKSVFTSPYGLPEAISIAYITAVHLWKKNSLLSIVSGTALYMFLVQVVF